MTNLQCLSSKANKYIFFQKQKNFQTLFLRLKKQLEPSTLVRNWWQPASDTTLDAVSTIGKIWHFSDTLAYRRPMKFKKLSLPIS